MYRDLQSLRHSPDRVDSYHEARQHFLERLVINSRQLAGLTDAELMLDHGLINSNIIDFNQVPPRLKSVVNCFIEFRCQHMERKCDSAEKPSVDPS
jgi:hypothetical protein